MDITTYSLNKHDMCYLAWQAAQASLRKQLEEAIEKDNTQEDEFMGTWPNTYTVLRESSGGQQI